MSLVGSAIFAALAAGAFARWKKRRTRFVPNIEWLNRMRSPLKRMKSFTVCIAILFWVRQRECTAISAGGILPTLRRVAAAARGNA